MRIRIRIGYVSIVVTYIIVVICVLFACHPFSRNWQINPDPGSMSFPP